MNADQISHGTPAAFREHIHEAVSRAAIQAEIAMQYAELGDDAGLEYAILHLVAYTKTALATVADLKAMNEKEASHG